MYIAVAKYKENLVSWTRISGTAVAISFKVGVYGTVYESINNMYVDLIQIGAIVFT